MNQLPILTAILMFALTAFASAQTSVEPGRLPSPDTDRAELAAIVMSSVTEMRLCRLADEKTQNPDVRSFCRSVVNDDARTALAGMQLAKTLGAADVKLAPSPETPDVIDALTQYDGHDFDRAFLLNQIENRENDQEGIRYAAEVETDRSVKRYEATVLPDVERDLHLAESALRTVSRDQP